MRGGDDVSDQIRRALAMLLVVKEAAEKGTGLRIQITDGTSCTANEGLAYIVEKIIKDLCLAAETAEELEGEEEPVLGLA